jgi:hypothetical protein
MEFIFQITQYNSDDALTDEVAAALEKQLELNSRKRLPAMWRFIDRNNSRQGSEGVIKQSSYLRTIYGIFLTVMGVILLVPGLMDPRELLTPLIAGIISVVTGVGCIWPWRKRSNHKFHKIAEDLLANMRKSLNETIETPLLVRFTAEGMLLPHNSLISYQDFRTILEVKSIYFLVWLEKVTILQKKDLVMESSEAFLAYLEEMTSLHRIAIVNVG